MSKLPSIVHWSTAFVLAEMAVLSFSPGPIVVSVIFLVAPIVVISLVVVVLRDRSQDVPQLRSGEHWGYQDRPDLRPIPEPSEHVR